ncbi:MAG: hypothetical protein V3S07_06075, partial [Micropepsaceae bacterium]
MQFRLTYKRILMTAAVFFGASWVLPASAQEETYEESEIASEVADFFEVSTVAVGEAVEKI